MGRFANAAGMFPCVSPRTVLLVLVLFTTHWFCAQQTGTVQAPGAAKKASTTATPPPKKEATDWARATKVGTPAAYNTYAHMYPKTTRLKIVNGRVDVAARVYYSNIDAVWVTVSDPNGETWQSGKGPVTRAKEIASIKLDTDTASRLGLLHYEPPSAPAGFSSTEQSGTYREAYPKARVLLSADDTRVLAFINLSSH
jgi:hypothetical protein